MVTPIAQSIMSILANRENKKSVIQKITNNLIDLDDQVQSGIFEMQGSGYMKESTVLKNNLKSLRSRFGRETINLVVIGRARQGKSRLLQTITGLDTTCIPDGGSLDCTAVKSVIVNANNRKDAIIHFYTRDEFFKDIIVPYYEGLKLDPVSTLGDFEADFRIGELKVQGGNIELKKHLSSYQANFSNYKELLGSNSETIQHSQIREFVAQDDMEGNRNVYSNYFAVKYVEVFARFPQAELGKVTVVDLPGIGDTKLGITENILEEIKNNIDIVFFIKKPSASGDHLGSDYIGLYDEISEQIKPIPLEKCSYLILNKDQANSKLCHDIKDEMPKSGLQVSDTKIVDVTNPIEVQQLMQDSLNHLTDNISEIDKNFIQSIIKSIETLSVAVKDIIEENNMKIFDENSGADKLDKLFKTWIENLRAKLNMYLDELREIERSEDGKYNKIFETNIENVRLSAESKKEKYKQDIMDGLAGQRGKKYEKIQDFYNEFRTELSKEFFDLDNRLDEIMDSMKQCIVDIFSDDEINIHRIIEVEDDPKITLRNLEEALLKIGMKENEIVKSLKNFREFRLLYRGIMHNKVRKEINRHLDIENTNNDTIENEFQDIQDNIKKVTVSDMIDGNWSTETIAEKIIEEDYDNAIKDATNILYYFVQEPDQTVTSITEELIDGIVIPVKIEDEWKALLRRNAFNVWQDEFDALRQQKENSQIIENAQMTIQKILNDMKQLGGNIR